MNRWWVGTVKRLQSLMFIKTLERNERLNGISADTLSSGTIDSWTLLQVLRRKEIVK